MLKEAQYPCWGFGRDPAFPEFNRVVYAIVGDCCYFSGVELELRTSTINAAESIVKAIAEQEGMPIVKLRWFDLQTHRGYSSTRPGKYELDELLIGPGSAVATKGGIAEIKVAGERTLLITAGTEDFVVAGWQPTPCPKEVLDLFREYIFG